MPSPNNLWKRKIIKDSNNIEQISNQEPWKSDEIPPGIISNEEWVLGSSRADYLNGWMEKDGSIVIQVNNKPKFLHVMPCTRGCFSMRYAVVEEWVTPGQKDTVNWDWNAKIQNFDLLTLIENTPAKFKSFGDKIPTYIKDRLRHFTYLQVEMLTIATTYRAGAQLVKTNLSLLWVIAESVNRGKIDFKSLPELFRQKQHEILSRLFYQPIQKSQLKFLRKYYFTDQKKYTQLELYDLIRVMLSRKHRLFRHWTMLTPELIAQGRRYGERYLRCIRNNLVTRDIKDWRLLIAEYTQLWHDTEQQWIGNPDRQAIVHTYTRIEQIETIHGLWNQEDYLAEDLTLIYERSNDDEKFPELNFNQDICPRLRRLDTPKALYEEGRIMRHCVASYKSAALREDCAIFAVELSDYQRLTLQISKEGQYWYLSQLRGKNNREPNEIEKQLVAEWIIKINTEIKERSNI
jgi:hypothetical protein